MWDTFLSWYQAFVDFLYKLLLSVFDFLKDFFFWILDKLISVAVGFLDLSGEAFTGLNPLVYFNSIPDETKAFLAMTGFNEAMSIIVIAIGIRFLLQLIPFVRWGS